MTLLHTNAGKIVLDKMPGDFFEFCYFTYDEFSPLFIKL